MNKSTKAFIKQLSFDELTDDKVGLILLLAYEGLIKALPETIEQPNLSTGQMTAVKKAYLKQFSQINND